MCRMKYSKFTKKKRKALVIALHPVYERKWEHFHYTDLMLVNNSTIHYPTRKDSKEKCKAHNYKVLAMHNTSDKIMVGTIYLHHVVTQLHYLMN